MVVTVTTADKFLISQRKPADQISTYRHLLASVWTKPRFLQVTRQQFYKYKKVTNAYKHDGIMHVSYPASCASWALITDSKLLCWRKSQHAA